MEPRDRLESNTPPDRRQLLGVLALFLVVFGLYAPSARFGFIHDDQQLILRQAAPTSLAEFAQVFTEPHWPGLPYYRPVTRATMVAQKYLHGDRPAPFHLFNAALVGLIALLVQALLRRPPFHVPRRVALFAAALYAVHPIASGAVYPVCSGRETLLPSFLILGSVYAYLSPGRTAYVAAIALATLAIFSKELAAVVPALFLLADLFGLTADPPGRSLTRWARRYAPLVVVFAIYFAIRWKLFGATLHPVAVFDRPDLPPLTLLYTLQTTFAPFAELVYEPGIHAWWSPLRSGIALAATAGTIFAALRFGVPRSILAFFAGWWIVTLMPTGNLLVQESPFAERYGFLALLGPVAVLALLAARLWDDPARRRLVAAAGIAAVAACSTLTFLRGPYLANELAFATQWVETDPGSYKAQLNMGQGLVERKQWAEGSTHLAEAARLRPNDAVIRNGLAYALWRSGDIDGAAHHFQRAIRIAPAFAIARANYGDLLATQGELDAAIEQYEHARRLSPRAVRTQRQLARALRRRGDLERASRHYLLALDLEPGSAITHVELGEVYEERGRLQDAARHFEAASRIQPEHRRARAGLERVEAHSNGG